MKKWDCEKLLNGIKVNTIISIFLVSALMLRRDKLQTMMIDLIFWILLILVTIQGFMVEALLKKLRTKHGGGIES